MIPQSETSVRSSTRGDIDEAGDPSLSRIVAAIVGAGSRARNLVAVLRHQGLRWALFRARYVIKNRLGWFERHTPAGAWSEKPDGVLLEVDMIQDLSRLGEFQSDRSVKQAEQVLAGVQTWFSHHDQNTGFPPDWFHTPWSDADDFRSKGDHWSRINECSSADVKAVWEVARFGMVCPLIRAYSATLDSRYAESFWMACEDWRKMNPPQVGIHWKCGQEVALRLIAWCIGFVAFRRDEQSTSARRAMLAEMIETSAVRIDANLDYALSQKNNHGISEAAGLFTAGAVLGKEHWLAQGEAVLERLAEELIYEDGSFSQHSINYHRLTLQLYLWVIQLANAVGRPLGDRITARTRKAGIWLRTMLVDEAGRVPNLGCNDGAHLFDLADGDYLDYRPTVQAVGLVIDGERWLEPGPWDEFAAWLGVDLQDVSTPSVVSESNTRSASCPAAFTEFSDGGYCVWRTGQLFALLRSPQRFRHRPAQCDLLHFDLWWCGINLLRDGGSYSYNCPEPWMDYFRSSTAHNTIRFDDRDPMPKITRFLYGDWPSGEVDVQAGDRVSASYRDYRGARHLREVRRTPAGFEVKDSVDGRFERGVLRWRLAPELTWTRSDNGCASSAFSISVTSLGSADLTFRVAEGWESLHYMQRSPIQVLEVSFSSATRKIISRLELNV